MFGPKIVKITPQELVRELQSANPPALLDVREAYEVAQGSLPNRIHIPLGELSGRFKDLNANDDLVVYCRSGARSAQAVGFLLKNGFKKIRNLEGGINGYIKAVDSQIKA